MKQPARDAKRLWRTSEAAINKIGGAEKEIAAKRAKFEQHFSDTFSRSFRREFPSVQLLNLLIAARGMVDEFVQTEQNAENPRIKKRSRSPTYSSDTAPPPQTAHS